ncbi:hypothetical protein NXX56_01850 [Bacteroides thetaiotaomicron]|nr:hypothetical protein [Bacteroides thetaiotaomicron]
MVGQLTKRKSLRNLIIAWSYIKKNVIIEG